MRTPFYKRRVKTNNYFTYLPKCRIYASMNWVNIGSGNSYSPVRHQAITWCNAGVFSFGPLGTNLSEILIEIYTFSFSKMRLKMSSAKLLDILSRGDKLPIGCVASHIPPLRGARLVTWKPVHKTYANITESYNDYLNMNKPLILTDILQATGLESTASGPNLLYPRDYLTRDIGHLVEPAAKETQFSITKTARSAYRFLPAWHFMTQGDAMGVYGMIISTLWVFVLFTFYNMGHQCSNPHVMEITFQMLYVRKSWSIIPWKFIGNVPQHFS